MGKIQAQGSQYLIVSRLPTGDACTVALRSHSGRSWTLTTCSLPTGNRKDVELQQKQGLWRSIKSHEQYLNFKFIYSHLHYVGYAHVLYYHILSKHIMWTSINSYNSTLLWPEVGSLRCGIHGNYPNQGTRLGGGAEMYRNVPWDHWNIMKYQWNSTIVYRCIQYADVY